jgi:hypothetical protein
MFVCHNNPRQKKKSVVLHFSAQKKTTLGYWNSYAAEYAVNSLFYQDGYGTNINITLGFLTPVTSDWYYSLMFESFGEPYPNGTPPYHPCSPAVDLNCNANSSGTWQAPCSFSFH